MKIKKILLPILLGGIVCWLSTAPAGASLPPSEGRIPSFDPVADLHMNLSSWPPIYSWALRSWSADDGPYRIERAAIDNSIKHRADPISLVEKYQASALAHPLDPKATFAFGYAYYKACLVDPKGAAALHFQSGKDPVFLLETVVDPNAFDYERLRFLQNLQENQNLEMAVAGYRLYVHNPDDTEVELALAQILDTYHPGPQRKLGFFLARDLVAKNPNSLVNRSLLSDDYFAVWQYSHSQADAANAIKAEKDWLALDHATPTKVASDLRIDQIKHYVPGQSYFILSPLNLDWYKRAVAKDPNDYDSWLQILANYYERWRVSRSKADASACINAIQHALDAGPKDDATFQSGLKATLAEVQSGVPRVYKTLSKSN